MRKRGVLLSDQICNPALLPARPGAAPLSPRRPTTERATAESVFREGAASSKSTAAPRRAASNGNTGWLAEHVITQLCHIIHMVLAYCPRQNSPHFGR
jgi:hypothetical protein